MSDPIPSELVAEMRDEAEIERAHCRHGTARLLDKAADLIERLTPAPAGYVLVPVALLDAAVETYEGEWGEANSPDAWPNRLKSLSTAPSPSPVARVPDRETLARVLCEQHGGDPDAVAAEEHDSWDGPLWTAFIKDADRILALFTASPSDGSGEGK